MKNDTISFAKKYELKKYYDSLSKEERQENSDPFVKPDNIGLKKALAPL